MNDAILKAMEAEQHHKLVAALVAEIPLVTEPWMHAKRARWLAAAASIFDLLYTNKGKETEYEVAEDPPAHVEPRERTHTSVEMPQSQRHVLEALQAMPADKDGWIEATIKKIGMDAGVSSGSIMSGLEALERKKIIEIMRRGGVGINRYRILAEAPA